MTFWGRFSMRVGLSYRGADHHYDAYEAALRHRAAVLDVPFEPVWLAGIRKELDPDVFPTLDALVLTGGADVEPGRYGAQDPAGVCRVDARRDAIEWAILERWEGLKLPLLAICRGAQLLNVFCGGSLIQDLAERNARHRPERDGFVEHGVTIRAGSLLHRTVGALDGLVNSSHHQAVERLAEHFSASATTEDGLVEAFEPADASAPFLLAVQWHPESMASSPLSDALVDALLLSKY